MSLTILKPGLQTTLQGSPRTGYRHMGVPWAGPADPLSLALANRLVGAPPEATALEITLGGLLLRFDADTAFALTGAPAPAILSGEPVNLHETIRAHAGDVLELAMPSVGMRTYLALAGTLAATHVIGSPSTYLPAGLGGHEGRACKHCASGRV